MAWPAIAAAIGGALLSAGGGVLGEKIRYKDQRKLRQNAYQDTMEDMREAGLNPILAYQKGATPTTAQSLINPGSDAVAGAHSGFAAKAAYEDWKVVRDRKRAEVALIENQAGAALTQSGANSALADKYFQEGEGQRIRNYIAREFMPGDMEKGKIYSHEASKKGMILERILDVLQPASAVGVNGAKAFQILKRGR